MIVNFQGVFYPIYIRNQEILSTLCHPRGSKIMLFKASSDTNQVCDRE